MKQAQLILFDIGGVLVDCNDSFKTAASDLNIPIELIDEAFDKYEAEITLGEISPQELYQYILKKNKISKDSNYNFTENWVKDYKVIPDSYDLLIDLSSHYKLGLLSNTYKGIVGESIISNKMPDILYAYKFLSCDLAMQKPNQDIYDYVENETGYKGSEILFIDDRIDFLEIPKRIGWQTVLYNSSSVKLLRSKLLNN